MHGFFLLKWYTYETQRHFRLWVSFYILYTRLNPGCKAGCFSQRILCRNPFLIKSLRSFTRFPCDVAMPRRTNGGFLEFIFPAGRRHQLRRRFRFFLVFGGPGVILITRTGSGKRDFFFYLLLGVIFQYCIFIRRLDVGVAWSGLGLK